MRIKQVFGRDFGDQSNFDLINAKSFYRKAPENYVRVDGIDLCLEIIKQNMAVRDPALPLYMMVSILLCFVPYIISLYRAEEYEFFQSTDHKIAFICGLFPTFMLQMLNLVLLNALRMFYVQKTRFKKAVLSMFDDQLREMYSDDCSADLP
jgi:hypothetical protein